MKVGAVIVAAGRGTRAGGGMPKQWREIAGKTVATHTIDVFSAHPDITRLVIVVHPDDLAAGVFPDGTGTEIVTGGETRAASVRAGLAALEGRVDIVLIHDAARPCVTCDVIDGVIEALEKTPAAAPAVPVVDALWRGSKGLVTETADRDGLFRAQTPQGFHLNAILDAYKTHPDGAADDVEIALRAGLEVAITAGSEDNLKITTPADFDRAEQLLRARSGH